MCLGCEVEGITDGKMGTGQCFDTQLGVRGTTSSIVFADFCGTSLSSVAAASYQCGTKLKVGRDAQ